MSRLVVDGWMDDLAQSLVLLSLPQPAYLDRKYEILCNLFPDSYLTGQTWWLGEENKPSTTVQHHLLPPSLDEMVRAWKEEWDAYHLTTT